jgi:lipopolysaccharide transport system ATP-binding protein
MSTAIKVENLSKQYRLGKIGTGSIAHDLNKWWYTIRGKENPYLKIGETNDRSTKGNSDYVWSLKDINFEIEQGDAVGIIGRNGAGKSTLLKILSRVTGPTTGSVKVKGRIASLLEVGTGFHPELSGRENIFLNGAILGMRKHEIQRKFDEIVDFSGVERYIDTPVKRYSSGMYVRLAFAVAAHLESEILIVDEVLAVGDAEFQKKCLGKMNDVSKGEGRTVLFVSHNISSILALCNKGILLSQGLANIKGDVYEVCDRYLSLNNNLTSFYKEESNIENMESLFIKEVSTLNKRVTFDTSEEIPFYLTVFNPTGEIKSSIAIILQNGDSTVFTSFLQNSSTGDFNIPIKGQKKIVFKLPANLLKEGTYNINLHVGEALKSTSQKIDNKIFFSIVNGNNTIFSSYKKERNGIIGYQLKYEYDA